MRTDSLPREELQKYCYIKIYACLEGRYIYTHTEVLVWFSLSIFGSLHVRHVNYITSEEILKN